MTLILLALWIAGHEFHWWWLVATVVFDLVWFTIKLNILAILLRRSMEETIISIASQAGPPPEA